jgi:HAD superfamily hydrolase (TIGR01484 family)
MRPLAGLDAGEARALEGVLFDLDDTVLSHGLLSREAFNALWDLRDAGLKLVAVTGRPSAWGEVIARQWPIDGVVTENGAAHIVRAGKGVQLLLDDDPLVTAQRARLDDLVSLVGREAPDLRLADDNHGRVTDRAWDIGERVTIPENVIGTVKSLLEREGARTTRSSVHLHATYERDDKASGAVRFLHARFGTDAGTALHRFAFAGDSANDAACFSAFETTFGVANVRAFVSRLSVPPRYVATKERGEGFAEIARAILSLRR